MRRFSTREFSFPAGQRPGKVSALLLRPEGAVALLVLAHGAGAGMRHKFMDALAEKLSAAGIATLRYQFPYMEKGIKRPDPATVLTATVHAAVATAHEYAGDVPVFAGGKSMGGRMTSMAAAEQRLAGARGLIFVGFPLHAAGKPSAERCQHLFNVTAPMLFLQGSRDALADLKRLKPLCARLGKRAELFVVDGGDHSFHMLKGSGRSDDEVLNEIAEKAAAWMAKYK
jgi:predicted alpha/beta-hydrolase family hydrolase